MAAPQDAEQAAVVPGPTSASSPLGAREDERGNKYDEFGARMHEGPVDPTAQKISQVLKADIEARSDQFAGVALSTDGSVVEVFAAKDGQAHADNLYALGGEHAREVVQVIPVEHSMKDLMALVDTIKMNAGTLPIVECGPRIEANAVVVTIDSSSPLGKVLNESGHEAVLEPGEAIPTELAKFDEVKPLAKRSKESGISVILVPQVDARR